MTVKQQLAELTNREIVAYWNILQMGCKMLGGGKTNPHLPLVGELLIERSIPHEEGRLINVVI